MSKKFIPVLITLVLGGVFLNYAVLGKSAEDPEGKYQRILRNVGIVLEQGHYNPKKIDDKFSKEVFKNYLNALDGDKYIFLQKDIDAFKKYETRIDDEIHGAPIQSFYEISKTYVTRLDELSKLYQEILTKPFDFTENESVQLDGEKRKYPTSEEQRYDYSRKRLKYLVLGKFVDLQDERTRNKDSAFQPDSTLQRKALETVSKQMNRYFQTLKTHNTSDDLFSTFVNAITSTMDPHTTYFAPIDKRTFDEQLSGSFYGIGAQLLEKDGNITVASLITGMPAWKSGQMDPGDIIIKIGQGANPPVDVTGYSTTDAVKLIRGEKLGSEVRLTLKKADGSIKEVILKRDKINLDDTFARSVVINGTHKIGYILLPEFYADFNDISGGRRSATDVAAEVQKLKDVGVDGIVIDLRGNGGGSLTDVVDMVGLFVKNGPVVQVKGRDEKAGILSNNNKEVLYDGPLAVMVDEMSASASEIFAAAIQDYKRGIILGSTSTYGKGTVQRSISLDPQAQNALFNRSPEGLGDVKLTFRKFYRINGGTTQKLGVIPDVIIPDRLEKAKFREKDNPDALGWDTIPKATYTLWNNGEDFRAISAAANLQIRDNSSFQSISEIINSLEKFRDEPVSLNINDFRKMQADIKAASAKLDSVSKLKDSLNISPLAIDVEQMGSDTLKLNNQKLFVRNVSGDIYVDEAVKIVNSMIANENNRKPKSQVVTNP